MLRVFLIVAVAAGLAAAVVGYMRVGGKMATLSTELTTAQTQNTTLQASVTKLNRDLRTSDADLVTTSTDLAETKSQLEITQARAAEQELRANQLDQERRTLLIERNEAQTELAVWRAFNRTPEQIRALIAENRRLVDENVAVSEENRVLARKLGSLENELAIYRGHNDRVVLRRDLRGEVIAVDPKFDFVVLSVGENDGVLERGEMLVNRGGKLVAKVRVLSVDPETSVANVLPDWRQADIMEGDAVIVGN